MINILFLYSYSQWHGGWLLQGTAPPSTNRQLLLVGLWPAVPAAGKPGWIEAGEQGEKAVLRRVGRVIEQSDLRVQSFIEMSRSGVIIWG